MSSLQVPLVDLHAQYQALEPAFKSAFERVLGRMQLFLGPELQAFEQEFAAYCGCQDAVGVSSGTDALTVALKACEIGPGDEVITVANTFIATVEAIAQVGAKPVFVDIDPDTYLMDWQQLERALSRRTRAILPVHLYGHPAPMQPVLEFAQAHHLYVIEDASQAHGATYQGQRVGSFGDIACFSLYYSKNLGAFGEAGICTTNTPELATKMRQIRDHGSLVRYQHDMLGMNARLDELQAAFLRIKLPHLEAWNSARRAHAAAYTEQLRESVRAVPIECPQNTHVYCYYVIQLEERDRLRAVLEESGIGTNIHYPTPIHLQPACKHYGYTSGSLPVTEAAARSILSLPMYPELTEAQRQLVIDGVKKACRVPA